MDGEELGLEIEGLEVGDLDGEELGLEIEGEELGLEREGLLLGLFDGLLDGPVGLRVGLCVITIGDAEGDDVVPVQAHIIGNSESHVCKVSGPEINDGVALG